MNAETLITPETNNATPIAKSIICIAMMIINTLFLFMILLRLMFVASFWADAWPCAGLR